MISSKKQKHWLLPISLVLGLLFGMAGIANLAAAPAYAAPYLQVADTDTPTATSTTPPDTATPTATLTATQAPTQSSYERPIMVISGYSTEPSPVNPGQDFNLRIQLKNAGEISARNVVISFAPGDILPRTTGGVLAVQDIQPGSQENLTQPMTVDWSVWGAAIATADATINYSDSAGNAYTESFTITISLNIPKGAAPTATPTPTLTPTAAALARAQVVITGYESDVIPLQPGSSFNLALQVENLGNITAKRVTMIVGGGSTISDGTPGPGSGVSGAGGEFSNFAPLGTSNIQSLGDIAAGAVLPASQPLIVNVTTNPGAYPMKISFAYVNDAGIAIVDEQVITLLVYSLPSVDISFYRDPGPLFTNQPNMLPIQINNLGRKATVFGNLRVSAPNGILENNVILVGSLEAGGYYTLDATYFPDTPGTTELTITVDYTDDFNQARQITRSLTVDIQEFIPPEDNFPPQDVNGGLPPSQTEETFWQKVWRFFLGLLGLDSGKPTPSPEGQIPEGIPVDGESAPISPPVKGP